MKKTVLLEKYPVCSVSIEKSETTYTTVSEIVEHLKNLIEQHKIAKYITVFDHYEHTKSIDGTINPDIKDAKNILFCFGAAMPNTKILAVRPRGFGVAELENSFEIEFIEAPKEDLTNIMETWAKSIANKI